jgi:hypothetical protein
MEYTLKNDEITVVAQSSSGFASPIMYNFYTTILEDPTSRIDVYTHSLEYFRYLAANDRKFPGIYDKICQTLRRIALSPTTHHEVVVKIIQYFKTKQGIKPPTDTFVDEIVNSLSEELRERISHTYPNT